MERIGDCLCLNAGGLGRPWGAPQVGFLRRTDDRDEVWYEHLDGASVRRLGRDR